MSINKILPYCVALLSLSCNDDFEYRYAPQHEENYRVVHKGHGDIHSDTVVLILQGGPMRKLVDADYIQKINDLEFNEELALAKIPYTIYNVHQSQTKDTTILNQYHLLAEEATEVNDRSARILHETITHFLSQGKYVVVHGISFGAFLLLRTIYQHGVTAHQYIVQVGRVDMPSEYLKIYASRRWGEFVSDGLIIKGDKYVRPKKGWSLSMLLHDIGRFQFTKLLKGMDLSKVDYVHALQDQRVGATSKNELSFLKAHNAREHGLEGNHSVKFWGTETYFKIIRKLN